MTHRALEIHRELFARPRDLRSQAYKDGVLAALQWRLEGKRIVSPFAPASAESDAFHAGCSEGHNVARIVLEQEKAA